MLELINKKSVVTAEKIRDNLAATYRILSHLKLDDLTYTHLSIRSEKGDSFYIGPLGLLYHEVTPSDLVEVSLENEVLSDNELNYNKTGYVIHGSIYKARPDVNAVIHIHTTAGVAVSCDKRGLLPISQFSFHFYENLGYHKYDSLALEEETQGKKLAEDLGLYNAMIMENHGTLSCGATIQEAFFYIYYLEMACRVQIAVDKDNLIIPSEEVIKRAKKDMRNFEQNLGARDFAALARKFDINFN